MILDARGRSHEFGSEPRRVVSLVPSLSETLFDLGAGSSLVGVTEFCIFPPVAAQVRSIGGTKTPDLTAIRGLAPDLVHMNLEENLERHAIAIEEFAPVFVSEPKTVRGVLDLIATLGAIHNRRSESAAWIGSIESELSRGAVLPFTFACAVWKDPWMWCGGDTYVSDLVSCAGGTNVLAGLKRYPKIPLSDLLAMRPEIVFLPDEPYAFGSADAGAIAGPEVIGPFPGHLFTWHGTRTLKGLRFLRSSLMRPRS